MLSWSTLSVQCIQSAQQKCFPYTKYMVEFSVCRTDRCLTIALCKFCREFYCKNASEVFVSHNFDIIKFLA